MEMGKLYVRSCNERRDLQFPLEPRSKKYGQRVYCLATKGDKNYDEYATELTFCEETDCAVDGTVTGAGFLVSIKQASVEDVVSFLTSYKVRHGYTLAMWIHDLSRIDQMPQEVLELCNQAVQQIRGTK